MLCFSDPEIPGSWEAEEFSCWVCTDTSKSEKVKFALNQAALWVQSALSCVAHGSCVISAICRVGVWEKWSLGENVCVTQRGSIAAPHSAAVLSSWVTSATGQNY